MAEPVSGDAPAAKGFWARCPSCDHVWGVWYLPDPSVERIGVKCPSCGGRHAADPSGEHGPTDR